MEIVGLSPIWPYSLSQPEIRDLLLGGISHTLLFLSLRGLPFSTRRSGYPRRGTCPPVQAFTTLFGQVLLIEYPRQSPRPLEDISLSPSIHGYRALDVLAQNSTPVRRLTILVADVSALNERFPRLAARLPHPEARHIAALVQKYDLVR